MMELIILIVLLVVTVIVCFFLFRVLKRFHLHKPKDPDIFEGTFEATNKLDAFVTDAFARKTDEEIMSELTDRVYGSTADHRTYGSTAVPDKKPKRNRHGGTVA